ncbi:MAG: GGDEF domain-containing protein [candidate division Zixibacteria bacterium]|nr:GGDEF domain-containing protein [candidate division Zixibacteria bacterium]
MSLIILCAAVILAAILILGSIPSFRGSNFAKLFLPVSVLSGLGVAAIAMYFYYNLRYKSKALAFDERESLGSFIGWNRSGFSEPQDLLRNDFKQFEQILSCKQGVLYVEEKEKYVPVAAFGLNLSSIKSFVPGDAIGLSVETLTEPGQVPDNLKTKLGWEAHSLYRFYSPAGTTAVAVFSELPNQKSEGIEEELFGIQINRISLELDYTISRFRNKILMKKIDEKQTEAVNLRKELKRKVYDIHTLFRESSNLYTILSEEKLMDAFLLMIMGQLALKKVIILCRDAKSSDFLVRFGRGIPDKELKAIKIRSTGRFISSLHSLNRPTTINEVEKGLGEDPELMAIKNYGVSACCKIVANSSTYGYLLVGEKMNEQSYRQSDLKLMSIFVNIVASALENIKHYRIIEELSFTDSMTGLYNYRYFYKRLNEEIFRARRYVRNLALVIFDIDDFKIYNDTFGHQAGDAVLRQLGIYLQKSVRAIDIVCRYGGEEFCIIMQESDENEVKTSIERLRKNIQVYKFESEFLESSQNITVSIGAAVFPINADTPDKLIYCADMAMLKAKSDGKNRCRMFSDLEIPDMNMFDKSGTNE